MTFALWALACAPHGAKAPDTAGETAAETAGETGQPDTAPDSGEGSRCTPVAAVFFDLGDTLLVKGDDGRYVARDGAEALLAGLRAQDRALGVITNVPDGWERSDLDALLADPSILDGFDVVLLSALATADPKPDPAIFVEAVGLLPTPPPIGTTVFVTEELGHIADADPPTEGAQAAGMVGVHLSDDAPDPLADHTLAPAALGDLATASWMDCLETGQ